MLVFHALQLLLGIDLRLPFHLASILLAPAMAIYAATAFSLRFSAFASAFLLLGGLGVEVLGTRTGFPFGQYFYTGVFKPQLFGVPLQIPVGWLTLGIMCYSIASLNFRGRPNRLLASAALMVMWDLLYDPLFVALGMWAWSQREYFGVPFSNFACWFIVSFAFFLALDIISGGKATPRTNATTTAPLAVYLAYALDGVISNAFDRRSAAGGGRRCLRHDDRLAGGERAFFAGLDRTWIDQLLTKPKASR